MIGEEEIQELEEAIYQEFPRFRELFQDEKGADVFRECLDSLPETLWTCFTNGSGKGGRGGGLDIEGWEGLFHRWIGRYIPLSDTRKLVPETFHRVDLALVDYGEDGGYREGKYKLLALLEQENQPEEVRWQTRRFYDLSAPLKLLLLWTDQDHSEPEELIRAAGDVICHCEEQEIPNSGTFALVVGDWCKLTRWLKGGPRPKEPLLRCGIIEPVLVT